MTKSFAGLSLLAAVLSFAGCSRSGGDDANAADIAALEAAVAAAKTKIERLKDYDQLENLAGIAILVVYLCGTLLLSDRRTGLVIILLGSLVAAAMPVLHMSGAGVGVKRSAGAFFFIWTLYALGVTGTFGVILSVRALLSARAR